jgi:hypothetical protein
MKKSSRFIVTAAALAGLYAGALAARTYAADDTAGSSTQTGKDATSKHACKGQNTCKGTGGCGSGDMGCAGKNTCKGKGGCATDSSAKPATPAPKSAAPAMSARS